MNTKRKPYKFNETIYLKAIEQGMTKTEAGRKAGLQAKHDPNIIHGVNYEIDKNPHLKKSVVEMYESFERKVLEEVGERDLTSEKTSSLLVSSGIARDKIQLIKGDPTQNIGILPKMVITGERVSFKEITPEIEQKPAQERIEGK